MINVYEDLLNDSLLLSKIIFFYNISNYLLRYYNKFWILN